MARTRGIHITHESSEDDPYQGYVYESESKEGGAYDFPKSDDGYLDDNRYEGQAYRRIDKWFLCTPGKEDRERLELPLKASGAAGSFNGAALYGELVPYCESEDRKKVQIKSLKLWTIDCSHETRGIWIKAKHWYHLISCSTEWVCKGDTQERICQDQIHTPMRAKFGLVSNLADMLGEQEPGPGGSLQVVAYIYNHVNQSPLESYKMLQVAPEELEKRPELNADPFDWELLRLESKFVKYWLDEFHTALSRRCEFVKGLAALAEQHGKARRNHEEWTIKAFDYKLSAEMAEKRSSRRPWGSMQIGVPLPTINRHGELLSYSDSVSRSDRIQQEAQRVGDTPEAPPLDYECPSPAGSPPCSPWESSDSSDDDESFKHETGDKGFPPNPVAEPNAFSRAPASLDDLVESDEDDNRQSIAVVSPENRKRTLPQATSRLMPTLDDSSRPRKRNKGRQESQLSLPPAPAAQDDVLGDLLSKQTKGFSHNKLTLDSQQKKEKRQRARQERTDKMNEEAEREKLSKNREAMEQLNKLSLGIADCERQYLEAMRNFPPEDPPRGGEDDSPTEVSEEEESPAEHSQVKRVTWTDNSLH